MLILRWIGDFEFTADSRFFAFVKPYAATPLAKLTEKRRNLEREYADILQSVKQQQGYVVPGFSDLMQAECDRLLNKSQFNVDAGQKLSRLDLLTYLDSLPDLLLFRQALERHAQTHIEKQEMALLDAYVIGSRPTHEGKLHVTIEPKKRLEHMYLIGKTGSGKTNTLTHLILQDINAGRGVGVMAPDAAIFEEHILPRIPPARINDVIYFNPTDLARPAGFNPLELLPGENIGLKVDQTYTILSRAVGGSLGAVMETLLTDALYALIERPGSTLFDIPRLLDLRDPSFREEIVSATDDEQTKHFWSQGIYDIPNIKTSLSYLNNRLKRLLRPPISTVLCPPRTTLNFRRAMDEQRIVLCNLSTGLLGEKTCELLGQLIASQFQSATMTREDTPEPKRVPFYFYLDEFQTFLGSSKEAYTSILSRARKYGLGIVLAHQQTGQIGEFIRDITGNVATLLIFQVNARDANFFKDELVNLIGMQGMRITDSDTWKEVIRVMKSQPKGGGFVRIGSQSYQVQVPLVTAPRDFEFAKEVIRISQRNYGFIPTSQTTTTGSESHSNGSEDDQSVTDGVDPKQSPEQAYGGDAIDFEKEP